MRPDELLDAAWLDGCGYEIQPSPFLPFGEYCFSLFDWLGALSEELRCEAAPEFEDEDWEMDCQDVHDVFSFLDYTGNLDAPL